MIMFKSCTRCHGDRSLEHDYDGWYILCLACGYVTYPEVPTAEARRANEDRKTA